MKKHILLPFLLLGILGITSCDSPKVGPVGPTGQTGAKGDKGEKGDTGDKGPSGDKGEKGDKGETGETGQAGANGANVLTGTLNPTAEIGKLDDIYINTTTWDVFTRGKDSWNLIGNIKGTKGDTGSKGETGATGENGLSPTVGENGNWWIGDVDTGIKADPDGENDPNVSDGFTFQLITHNHKPGYKITAYNGTDKNVVVPQSIGGVPVVGTSDKIFNNIETLKLTPNIEFLGLIRTGTITKVDFNGAKIKKVKDSQFLDCYKLNEVIISDYVETLGHMAFANTAINDFDFKNVKVVELQAFDHYQTGAKSKEFFLYVPKTVKSLDLKYLEYGRYYLEVTEEEYNKGDYNYYLPNTKYFGILQNKDYIYAKNNNEISLYQKRNTSELKDLIIPSEIDGLPVTTLKEGFATNTISISNNPETLSKLRRYWDFEKVSIPNTIKTIESGVFRHVFAGYVCLPSSIETNLNEIPMFSDQTRIYYDGDKTKFDSLKFNFGKAATIMNTNFNDLVVSPEQELFIKRGDTYSFEGFLKGATKFDTIPIHFNNIKITEIGTKAVKPFDTNYFIIPDGVNKLGEEAINVKEEVYFRGMLDNYELSPNAIKCGTLLTKLPGMSSILEGTVITTKPNDFVYEVENLDTHDHYLYYTFMKSGIEQASILQYLVAPNESSIGNDIKIPRKINEVPVTETHGTLIDSKNITKNINIYIPKEVKYIDSQFVTENSNNNTINIYLECSKDYADTNFAPDWCDRKDNMKICAFYDQTNGFNY